MDRYKLLEEVGDGTCGCVYRAVNMETYEIVAVKKMKRKFYFWDECMNLREVKALRKLSHPNIIKLKEVVRENNQLFFVFEHMEYNLYQFMRDRQRPFTEEEIRSFMTQILNGLAHMHRNGYFHRDLKPENLLVTNQDIKIADFGLAREVDSMPPYTDYVSTRWYRAPEVLLRSSSYSPAIDMWAVGAILAELFTTCPIFPGESEADQLYKICRVLGAPDWNVFPGAKNITGLMDISNSEIVPANLSRIIPNASLEAIDLITRLCSWDPLKRPSAEQALHHPFFYVNMWVPRPIHEPVEIRQNNRGAEPNLELNLWDFDNKSDDCFLSLTLAVKPSAPTLEMAPSASQGSGENFLFYSSYQDHQPEQSVFWSLFSPSRNMMNAPAESSLPLTFSSIPHHTQVGVSQSPGYAIPSMQQSMLDGPPLLAASSPLQQVHFF